MVGKGGFEPPTSCSRSMRANQAALLPEFFKVTLSSAACLLFFYVKTRASGRWFSRKPGEDYRYNFRIFQKNNTGACNKRGWLKAGADQKHYDVSGAGSDAGIQRNIGAGKQVGDREVKPVAAETGDGKAAGVAECNLRAENIQ